MAWLPRHFCATVACSMGLAESPATTKRLVSGKSTWISRADGPRVGLTASRNGKIPGSLISASLPNGKRLVFLKGNPQGDVYVGDLDQNGKVLTAQRRLTLNDLDEEPSDWTPDCKSVLFYSNRNGTYDIFRQSLDETTAQTLVENKRVKTRPRMSPDGNWVLYYDPPGNARIERLRISRVPLAGGPTLKPSWKNWAF